MIEFVYPNFLGTLEEFKELFEQPIQKGQCLESSQDAVRLMKERVYILHSELNQIVHRRDDTTLTKILPRMEEHVLMLRLTPLQQQLYQKAISHLRDSAPNPLKQFATLSKIWNHPDVLYKSANQLQRSQDLELDDESCDSQESVSFEWAKELLKSISFKRMVKF